MTEPDLIGFLKAGMAVEPVDQPKPNTLTSAEGIPRGLIVPSGLRWSDPNADPIADILAFRDGALTQWKPPAPQPDFAEQIRTELVRLTLERFERAVWDPNAIVTEAEARDVVTAMNAERQRGEQIMANIREWADTFKEHAPQKIVMSSRHLEQVRSAVETEPQSRPFGMNVDHLLALPVTIDETARWPRLEPLHRRLKRSDITTRILLRAVAEHGTSAWEHLCRSYPAKVVLAAIHREVDRGRLNYGVSERRPFLDGKGRNWLLDNPEATS